MKLTETIKRIHAQIDSTFDDHLERCRTFLRQPSVSATQEGILETAAMVQRFIEEVGGTVSFEGAPEFPILYGRVPAPERPRLIIYGMYDVMPAEPTRWASPPFAAEVKDLPRLGPCVIARGAMNSKGALAGMFNALRSIAAVDRIPLDLIFTIEGAEEIGSPSFEDFVRKNQHDLKGVGVVDFDFSEDSKRNIEVHLGLKGIVYLELKCRGGSRTGSSVPQHSSASAWIASPVWRLVHALSTLVDKRERITIDGFYDNVAKVSKGEARLLKRLASSFDEKHFLKEMKALCFKYRISGVELLRKGLYLPIINIDGIHAGYAGKGSKTTLPRVATANIDIRFGPNLEPEEVIEKFKAHLTSNGYDDIDVRVKEAYTWSKTDVDDPLVHTLIAAYREHGRDPQVWPMATWTAPYFVFSRILRLPVVSGGVGHGGGAHSPNEYMSVEGLRDFEKWVVTFLYRLAEQNERSADLLAKS